MDIPVRTQVLKIFGSKGVLSAPDLIKLTGMLSGVIYASTKSLRDDGLIGYNEGTRPLSMFIKQKGLDELRDESIKLKSLDPDRIAKHAAAFNQFLLPPAAEKYLAPENHRSEINLKPEFTPGINFHGERDEDHDDADNWADSPFYDK